MVLLQKKMFTSTFFYWKLLLSCISVMAKFIQKKFLSAYVSGVAIFVCKKCDLNVMCYWIFYKVDGYCYGFPGKVSFEL